MHLCDVVTQLQRSDGSDGGDVGSHTQVGQAADVNGRQTTVARYLRYSLDAELSWNAKLITVQRKSIVDIVDISNVKVIGERWVEDVSISAGNCVVRTVLMVLLLDCWPSA